MYFAIQLTSFAVNIRIIRRKDAVIRQIIRRKNAVISDCIRRILERNLGYVVNLKT